MAAPDYAWEYLVARRLIAAFVADDRDMVDMIQAALRSDMDFAAAVPLAVCALLCGAIGDDEEVTHMLQHAARLDFDHGESS